jgi:LytR cell envelope-related transcriptional attenuator
MTTTLISKIQRTILKISFGLLFLLPTGFLYAQEALTLSISPSLFDMSVNPNQEWRSSLRVINVNDYDLTVYIEVVNFLPQGEAGSGRFLPIDPNSDAKGSTLAEWFIISREAITIPREQSLEVPIAVRVPEDAAPGGHFAAILIGTKPLSPGEGAAKVQTSQMVTSLFFARVAGDIREQGVVREFTTSDSLLSKPQANFELRFENKGNVHLQPQGEIEITNMWGQERGLIPINQSTQFGNVLPLSIRKFNFSWKGEWSFSDIGRYTAVVTLAYGTEARQFATATTYFWVIPFKLLLGVFLTLVVFGMAVSLLVKLYVRKMLATAGINMNEYKPSTTTRTLLKSQTIRASLRQPIVDGLNDFRAKLSDVNSLKSGSVIIYRLIIDYKVFFAALMLLLAFLSLIIWYVAGATTDQRGYEVEYVNSDANLKLTSEEIIYNQLRQERTISISEIDESLPKVKVVNRSGAPGLGAEVKLRLEEKGYEVVSLESDFTVRGDRTVVVYSSNDEREALRLSARLNNAPISTYEIEQEGSVMTVYVGDDVNGLD